MDCHRGATSTYTAPLLAVPPSKTVHLHRLYIRLRCYFHEGKGQALSPGLRAPHKYQETVDARGRLTNPFRMCPTPGRRANRIPMKAQASGYVHAGLKRNHVKPAIFMGSKNQEHQRECMNIRHMRLVSVAPQPTRAKAGLEGPSPSTAVGTR